MVLMVMVMMVMLPISKVRMDAAELLATIAPKPEAQHPLN